jgi:pimeloyl-ACP methyl ester carboxylesterase
MVRVPLDRKGPRTFPPALRGKVFQETVESRVLQGNPLGDPTSRTIAGYLPPSGVSDGKPLLLWLSGYGGAGWTDFDRPRYLQEPFPQMFERLLLKGVCKEATLATVDCLTALGGSQFVNSTATGRYEDFVVAEVVPWLRERFRPSALAVFGQSSGGFGALHLAMRHPDLFAAVGSSSGDMAFEITAVPDFVKAFREFQKHGGPEEFLAKFFEDPLTVKGPLDASGAALITLGVAACYSPNLQDPTAIDLPFDLRDGSLVPSVWERWLAFDPLRRVVEEPGRSALRRSKLVHITASTPDEWCLDVGARQFAALAKREGIPVLHEEFQGGHFQARPRYESLCTHLVAALS